MVADFGLIDWIKDLEDGYWDFNFFCDLQIPYLIK